jgi:acyl dehydratase
MENTGFTVARNDRYFEDYQAGAVFEFGPFTINEQEIIEFALKYDPQIMHLDPEKAKHTPYRGLIASGWHSVALGCRVYVENFISAVANIGSPGVDELRWLLPVRPGDVFMLRVTVLESKPSRSKQDRGLGTSQCDMINQHGQVVTTAKVMNLLLRRNPAKP